MIRLPLILCLAAVPLGANGLELAMPDGSALIVDEVNETGSYAFPDAVFQDGTLPTRLLKGHVSRQIWHLTRDGLESEQLIAPLRSQLEAAGFNVVLDCDAQSCGGFDFRFATEVLPAPEMFVDLVNYRFISAIKDGATGLEAISALASTSDIQGFTQLIAVQPGPGVEALPLAKPSVTAPITPSVVDPDLPSDMIKSLDVNGHIVLSDLKFETGSSNLEEGSFTSLTTLADYLTANPAARIALVGHTDSVGSLENNIALSEKRARAVRKRLINGLGAPGDQIDAKGVGYLAPIASNLTETGRNANRRVEAILLTK